MRSFTPGLGLPYNVSFLVKRILLVMALAIPPAAGLVLVAHSTAEGASCSSGTLATYVSLFGQGTGGGCTIGGETFSNFKFVTGVVSASSVTVTPVTAAGNPGLIFEGLWNQAAGNSSLFFDVSSAPLIKDVSLSAVFTSSATLPITGATASLDEGCSYTVSPTGCVSFDVLDANSIRNPNPDIANFTPVAIVGIDTLDFDANSGILTKVTIQFSEVAAVSVPEPGSIMLLGTGVLGLVVGSGILRRRL